MHEPAVFTARTCEVPCLFSYPEFTPSLCIVGNIPICLLFLWPAFSSGGKLMLFQITHGKFSGELRWPRRKEWESCFCSSGANSSPKRGVAQPVPPILRQPVSPIPQQPGCAGTQQYAGRWNWSGRRVCACSSASTSPGRCLPPVTPLKSGRVKGTGHVTAWPFVLISWADLKLSRA